MDIKAKSIASRPSFLPGGLRFETDFGVSKHDVSGLVKMRMDERPFSSDPALATPPSLALSFAFMYRARSWSSQTQTPSRVTIDFFIVSSMPCRLRSEPRPHCLEPYTQVIRWISRPQSSSRLKFPKTKHRIGEQRTKKNRVKGQETRREKRDQGRE